MKTQKPAEKTEPKLTKASNVEQAAKTTAVVHGWNDAPEPTPEAAPAPNPSDVNYTTGTTWSGNPYEKSQKPKKP